MVDRRRHDGAVHPQLTPAGHAQLAGQGDHMVQQRLERVRLEQLRPAQQGRVIGHPCQPQAAELPQHQAVADEVFGLGITPAVQPLDDQQAQHDLHRRRRAAGLAGARPAVSEVGADGGKERVVVEQLVQAGQDRFELQRQGGDQGEQIDGRATVAEHRHGPSGWMGGATSILPRGPLPRPLVLRVRMIQGFCTGH